MKPIIEEEIKVKKVIKIFLDNLLRSGKCEEVYIVTGEKTIFETDRFIDACKAGIESYPPLKIEIIAQLSEQELESVKKKVVPIQKNLKVYKVRKHPPVHFWLIKTKDDKTYLYLQRKHLPGNPKDEWFVENPFFLKWKYALKFKFCRKTPVLTPR